MGIPKISIIIPAYNEEGTIGPVLQQIEKILQFLPLEVILVDDGSHDGTVDVVRRFPFVRLIRHGTNQGKGAALRTGVNASKGEILVIQDADLEYSPSEIPQLIEPILTSHSDVVYGSRFMGMHDGMSFSHYIGNKLLTYVTRILYNVSITDVMTGFKCFKREVFESLHLKENGFNVEIELTTEIIKGGWQLSEIPIKYYKRNIGDSKITMRDGISSMIKLLRDSIS